jgi:hypothetical protein
MRKRISPATIIVLVAALFVVLTGTATAAKLITGAQIKNGSIGLVDLSAKAKKALRGQRGPAGPQGPAGAQGVPGPAGGFDPAKVSYVQGQSLAVAPDSFGTATAACPAGAKALSGGWLVESDEATEVDATNSFDSGGSWTVVVYNWSLDVTATVKPFAVCAAR